VCCENESRAGNQAETGRDTIQGPDYPERIGTKTSGCVCLSAMNLNSSVQMLKALQAIGQTIESTVDRAI